MTTLTTPQNQPIPTAARDLELALYLVECGRLGADLFSLNSNEIAGVREKIVAAQAKVAPVKCDDTSCGQDLVEQTAHRCGLCGEPFCFQHWIRHLELELVEWRGPGPKTSYADAVIRVADHERPLLIVKEPHYEGGGGDDGTGVSYSDEGWTWEDGTSLTEDERDELSDTLMDFLSDALRR